MDIHATRVSYFTHAESSDADAAMQKLTQAFVANQDVIFLPDVTLECPENGHGNAIIKIVCVGHEAGEVMRTIEGMQA